MLKEWEKSEKPSEEEIKARLEAVKEKLARQQLLITIYASPLHSCVLVYYITLFHMNQCIFYI